jgi:NAD(P)-dependent dehydrogenase (short-subunit alcohol dehydrogenase family)
MTGLIAVLLAVLPFAAQAQAPSQSGTAMKAVLVTGASTGIGRKVTERLAEHGYFVYAGARKDSDMKDLSAIKNVQPVKLDVTKAQDIDAAVATITKAGRGLYALVNNAGVVTIGSVVDTSMDEFDTVMAVNVYGPWRVTRAFAPLIIASKGRIATIGSINGIFTSVQASAYSMSKHAMEAFSDVLAEEMAPLGVKVSIVEPGTYKSEIFRNEVKRSGTGGQVVEFAARAKEPDDVAIAVEHALFNPNPKRRYLVVPNAQQAEITVKAAVRRLVQLNEGQPYTYDRATLVKMLDEVLAGSRPKTN